MRTLSLDEKISIKGKLSKKGLLPSMLVRLSTASAAYLHWKLYGTPVSMHSTPKMWRRRTPRAALMH